MDRQKLRRGCTTGTCAQGAAKAAAELLFGIREAEETEVWVELPKGERRSLRIRDIKIEYKETKKFPVAVSCAVKKDSGDDPDITDGVLVYSKVRRTPGTGPGRTVTIDGGAGIGRVTKPGLDQPVGAAAINRVPRQMILKEVEIICGEVGYEGGISVELSIPGGGELAKRTFNPRLGIEGGLSILGTSGIVEPMSEQAILDTIYLEMKVKLAGQATGRKCLVMAPGNYGLEFLEKAYGIQEAQVVKCSNFIGQSVDMARELGCGGLLLAGHIGKLVKVAGGIMNTHSAWADCRMEILSAAALRAGLPSKKARELLACVTADDALSKCSADERRLLMGQVMEKMMQYLRLRAGEDLAVEAVTFSKVYGILGKSAGADEMASLGFKPGERAILMDNE